MKIAAIDFETANRNPASVCSVGISSYEDGAVEERYYSLIRPEEDVFYFDPWNIRIHGIRPRDVLDAPDFETVELSRRLFTNMPHHRLNDMCDALHIVLNHHNAASDAMGCLMIVVRVMEKSGIYDIEELLNKAHVRIRELRP